LDEAGMLIVADEAAAVLMTAALEARGFVVTVVEPAPFSGDRPIRYPAQRHD
jgi:hypothetical protein